ncbi:hypothetical protein CYD30_20355 [Kosakonia cowanii]|nr:hypothetical protein CYD30_20355 [Kosakonia cowanii]
MRFVGAVSEAPSGKNAGWRLRLIRPTVSAVCRCGKRSAIGQKAGWRLRLIRPTVSAVCRPDKRSAIGQSVTPALLKRAARTTLRLRRAAPARTVQW